MFAYVLLNFLLKQITKQILYLFKYWLIVVGFPTICFY